MKIKIIITIFMVFSAVSCNIGNIKVKPQPPGGNWEICPQCKGVGIAEITESKSPLLEDSYDKNMYSCLMPFGLLQDSSDENYKYHFDSGEPYSYPLEEKNYKRLQEENALPKRSMMKRRVKCPRCAGIGWINL